MVFKTVAGLTLLIFCTVNPHYTDFWYNGKLHYTDNLTNTETLSQEVTVNQKLCRNIFIQYFKHFKQHMFGYLLEGDSNKYQKHTFYEEIRKKKKKKRDILFCSLRIIYNSKFIFMAISLGTNVVVVTRVHCITLWPLIVELLVHSIWCLVLVFVLSYLALWSPHLEKRELTTWLSVRYMVWLWIVLENS